MSRAMNIALAAMATMLCACGSNGGKPDGGDPPPTCSTTSPDSLCVVLSVPAGFTGSPVKLMALGFESLPPAGMPSAFFADVPEPDIGLDQPFKLEIEDISFTGTTHFYLALYMPGGGTMSPVEGVDYVGAAPEALTFDGTPLNLDPIELFLY